MRFVDVPLGFAATCKNGLEDFFLEIAKERFRWHGTQRRLPFSTDTL